MKKLKTHIIPILLLLIVSCAKTPKERVLKMKDVFPTQKNTDSTLIISFDSIKYFSDLENIICDEENENKYFYFRNNNYDLKLYVREYTKCSSFGCVLIKEKNTLYVNYKSDSVSTGLLYNENFTVKKYEKLLSKQFMNRGEKPSLSDLPHKVITFLTLVSSANDFEEEEIKLKSKLDTVSIAYFNFIESFKRTKKIDSLKKFYPLNLSIYIPIPPPPSSPPPIPIDIY